LALAILRVERRGRDVGGRRAGAGRRREGREAEPGVGGRREGGQ